MAIMVFRKFNLEHNRKAEKSREAGSRQGGK